MRDKLPQYNTIADAIQLIRQSQRIVILTGAGISKPPLCIIPISSFLLSYQTASKAFLVAYLTFDLETAFMRL
jgi:hypothetical protein